MAPVNPEKRKDPSPMTKRERKAKLAFGHDAEKVRWDPVLGKLRGRLWSGMLVNGDRRKGRTRRTSAGE